MQFELRRAVPRRSRGPLRFAAPRQVYAGLYGEIDLDCCIARSADEYVEIALRLGRDAQYRRSVSNRSRPLRAPVRTGSDAGLALGEELLRIAGTAG